MKIKEKERDKISQSIILLAIYLAFQILLCIFALMNDCWDNYLGIVLFQWVIGILGIVVIVQKEGDAKLVLYSGMLLSIGQLIQALIQEGDSYLEYQKDYQTFILLTIAGCVILYFIYRKFFHVLYGKAMQIVLCVITLGIFVLLKSPVGYEQNGALLWVRLGGFVLQLSEFLKPLLVIALAGILCHAKKVSMPILLGALVFTGIVSGLCVVLLNEFGTGMVLAITGIVMIYIFQNTRTSKIIIGLVVAAGAIVFVCYGIGTKCYRTIPMEVTPQIFAEQFAACCDKSDLVVMLNTSMENMNEDERKKKEAKMGVTYTEICNFLTYQIQDSEVNTSYPGATDEGLSSIQQKYINYIKTLAQDEDFRRQYRDEFIERKIYTNRILDAYEKYQEMEIKDWSFAKKIIEKAKNSFLQVYFPVAAKVQSKFSGFLDPKGESVGNAYQVNQAMAAMSTGGLWGNGSKINKNDETRIFAFDSDMVFTMIVAELGLIMGLLVIILNMLIFQEMIYVAIDTHALFQKGICIGMGCSWIVQTFLIIGGNCRVLPFTGITLPLISNGGTSLIISLMMVMFVILISIYPMQKKRSKKNDTGRAKQEKVKTEVVKSTVSRNEQEEEKLVKIDKTQTYSKTDSKKEGTEELDWENPFRDM